MRGLSVWRADLVWLHAGAKDFVQEALDAGAKVATIAGTCSTPEEKVAEAALEKLGVGSSDRRGSLRLALASSWLGSRLNNTPRLLSVVHWNTPKLPCSALLRCGHVAETLAALAKDMPCTSENQN